METKYLREKESTGSSSVGKIADKTTDCLVGLTHLRFAPKCPPSSRDFLTLRHHEVETRNSNVNCTQLLKEK